MAKNLKLIEFEAGIYTLEGSKDIWAFQPHVRDSEKSFKNTVVFSTDTIERAIALAKEANASAFVAVEISVKGSDKRISYAIPAEEFMTRNDIRIHKSFEYVTFGEEKQKLIQATPGVETDFTAEVTPMPKQEKGFVSIVDPDFTREHQVEIDAYKLAHPKMTGNRAANAVFLRVAVEAYKKLKQAPEVSTVTEIKPKNGKSKKTTASA